MFCILYSLYFVIDFLVTWHVAVKVRGSWLDTELVMYVCSSEFWFADVDATFFNVDNAHWDYLLFIMISFTVATRKLSKYN